MSNDRYVTKHPDGWAVRQANASRPSRVFDTQGDAEQYAKGVVRNLGGGEVRIQGRDGRFRDSDTVAPGNDPCPPKDRKH